MSAKFGVRPHSIPDWLALVGDAADGLPGVPGWGAKSAGAVLSRFDHLEALLYRRLATLRDDVPLAEDVADLEWRGPTAAFGEVCRELGDEGLAERGARRHDAHS